MNADFLNAVAPSRFTILGQSLEPFSIGHAVILSRLGCDKLSDVSELVLAVLVCCKPASEWPTTFDDGLLRFKMWLWRRRLGAFDFLARRKLFISYTKAASKPPHVAHKRDGAGLMPGAPFLWHVKVTLQSKLNYTPREAFDAPLGVALWDYFTYWENEGEAEIIGEDARAMFALANEMHDRLAALGREALQRN